MATITALGVGSGLDLNGLLDQLESAERQKLAPLNSQKTNLQSRISAFGALKSALSEFQGAVSKLNDANVFRGVSSSVSGTAVTAAARPDAATGTYQVDVHQLARGYSVATQGVADKSANLGAGSLTLELADNSSMTVELEAGKSSLEDLRNAINAQKGGVRASIVNDGGESPYRLALSSVKSGTDAAIANIDFAGLALSVDESTEVAARNASLTVNGISISSQSNEVKDAVQGLTLVVAEEGTAAVTVATDKNAISGAVKGFVIAYNGLRSTMSDLTSFDAETGAAGQLLGNSTMRSVQSQLRSVMSGGVAEGELRQLSDIGISLQLNGNLKLDEGRLQSVVDSDSAALSTLFAGSSSAGGLAGKLGSSLGQMLSDRGLINSASRGLEAGVERIEQRRLRMEQTIELTLSRYRTQFSQLDSMIANMNSTGAYLAQQFDAMNAQLGGGRR